ncbi:MAG: rod shape-determining protein MreC [Rickettsiales bacterium]|nr:rod shape-determining protein MreC [Rickettsiales bacterium]
MSKTFSHASSRAPSLQDWAGRFVFIALFFGSVLLVAIGRFEDTSMGQVQQKVSGFLAPIGSFIASPVETSLTTMTNFQTALSNATNANQLAAENVALQQWKLRAEQLQAENTALRQLMKVVPVMNTVDLTVRVLGSVAGPYSHQLQLAAGSDDGVKENMAVVDGHGLVGRVMGMTGSSSQVLTLTDINSRVAVVTGKSREHAVVKGLGEGYLGLYYLPEDTKIQLGEKLYTSGDGGLMSAGILVGAVVEITETGVTVAPIVDRARLDYVRLLIASDG